jgi:hypothetical protein
MLKIYFCPFKIRLEMLVRKNNYGIYNFWNDKFGVEWGGGKACS